MPRYAHADGTVWSIEQAGTQLLIDAGGKQTTRKFVTAAHAEMQLAKLTAEKLAAGFELAGAAPRRRPDDADARLIAEIERDPNDATAYVVYGDSLQRRGDPRGELIALMGAAEAKPGKKTRAAVAEFLDEHADELLGSLADQVAVREYDEEPFVWRHGFLHRVRLDAQVSQIRALLAHPSARFVAELALHGCTAEAIAILADKAPPTLRVLELHSLRDIGDLGELWQAVPHLRSLRVHARDFELGAIALPEVERVDLAARLLSGSCVRTVASAAWPRLERLALRLGNFVPRTERTTTFDDLLPLLRRTDLSRLTHLRIARRFASRCAIELGTAAFAPQLVSLDLSGSDLDDDATLALARHAGRFTALRELIVVQCALTTLASARLREVTPTVVDRVGVIAGDHLDRDAVDGDDDDDGDDDHFDSIEE